MKKYSAVIFLAIFCFGLIGGFAQSRRVPPSDGKANKREAKPIETPTPVQTPNGDEELSLEDKEVISVDTNLVAIPVKVSDRKGRFIGGLTKADFQVFEDNAEQEIAYFNNEEQPFTVALVLDMSYSSTFKIAEIQSAATAFIAQLRPNDKVMVVSFDEQIHVLCNPTSDRKALLTAVRSTKIASGTSLYDAMDLIINQKFRGMDGRKAVVLFTDGVDTTSHRAFGINNLSDALEFDALVYPIQYDTFNDVQAIKNRPPTVPTVGNPFPIPNVSLPTNTGGGGGTMSGDGTSAEEYRKADEYLNEMANRTSGRIYKASSTGNLALAFSNIASELRQFYSLGYYPKTEAKTGSRRKIKVRVNRPNVAVRSRDFYIVGKNNF